VKDGICLTALAEALALVDECQVSGEVVSISSYHISLISMLFSKFKVVDPITYAPLWLPAKVIDSCLLPMLLATNTYIRVVGLPSNLVHPMDIDE